MLFVNTEILGIKSCLHLSIQPKVYINCKTYFSFRYGTFSTKELVKAGVDNGVTALALTNINSTCDIWDFVKYCREEGLNPLTEPKYVMEANSFIF